MAIELKGMWRIPGIGGAPHQVLASFGDMPEEAMSERDYSMALGKPPYWELPFNYELRKEPPPANMTPVPPVPTR